MVNGPRRNSSQRHQRRRDDTLRELLAERGVTASCPMLARCICWIRTGNQTALRKWERCIRLYGLDTYVVEETSDNETPGWVTVYDVAATPEMLLAFLESGTFSLLKWEFAVAGTSVGHGGAVRGSGATKKK